MKILIAGIGNIFHGDDAFGCEVISQLPPGAFPENITAIDYGIRSYDLAFALNKDYDAVILVDATSRGRSPGTTYLIEPDVNRLDELGPSTVDAHAMNPVSVIQMAQSLGGVKAKLFLVGCEPSVLENEDGEIGVSPVVRAAIPQAISMIQSLVADILSGKEKLKAAMQAA